MRLPSPAALRAVRARAGRRPGGEAGDLETLDRPPAREAAGRDVLARRGPRWTRCSPPRPIWAAWRAAARPSWRPSSAPIRSALLAAMLARTAALEPEPLDLATRPRRRLRRLKARTAPAHRPGRSRRRLGPGPGHRRPDPVRRRRRPRRLAAAARAEIERGRPAEPAAGRRRARSPARACSASPWASTAPSSSTTPATSTSRSSTSPRPCRWPTGVEPQAFATRFTQTAGRYPAGTHQRRLCLPRRPAPAARPLDDAAGRAGGGGARLLPDRGPELGAGGLHQGPGLRRRRRRRPGLPGRAAALHLAAQPGLRRHRRHPLDQAPDPCPQGGRAARRQGRRRQARPRRHPRDRVLRPDPAADPRAAATARCARAARRAPWPPWPRPDAFPPTPPPS